MSDSQELNLKRFRRCALLPCIEMPRVKGVVVKCALALSLLGLLSLSWRASHSSRDRWQDGRGMETRSSSPASYVRSMKVAPPPSKEDEIYRGN